ncbi:GDP dissociation inhibitor [Xylariaceae sp. FL1651]|nr:GDP dissociation inhibitor [Xylariaceae sp. FL1651]
MDSLSGETWDAVICGTGLSQSLLALALSRSKKRILHLDPNEFYGEHEAALSLQEADAWVEAHASAGISQQPSVALASTSIESRGTSLSETRNSVIIDERLGVTTTSARGSRIFRNANVWKITDAEARGLSFPRAYSLALAPQIIHTKSKLLSQLVSSRAYRQVEFLAVGSFFIYDTTDTTSGATLARIPSSREDVFSTQSIPARSKRSLMKFLKFVIDYDSDEQTPVWQGKADRLLAEFLCDEFKLDGALRNYILALTLSLDGEVTVQDGLAAIHRHLTSTGLFGPGFCAVYPKWGGMSEIAQVGCRAGAVGGGIYMLNTQVSMKSNSDGNEISLNLSNDVSVQSTVFISSQHTSTTSSQTIARLVVVINSPLQSLFEILAEGAPTPSVAVVAFLSGSLRNLTEPRSDVPVYAFVHSSDTGECPSGQSVIYLTTLATSQAVHILDAALVALLQVAATSAECLYKLYYEQTTSARQPLTTLRGNATVFEFPSPSLGLAFDDASLEAVKEAWKLVMKGDASDDTYLIFEDREGMGDDDDIYE